jgi:transketolase
MTATAAQRELDLACVQLIRTLSIDAVQQANSGHPGLPLGAAPMAYALWQRHLAHNPADPHWPNRDRFVLSAGHGSMLLYALLHLTGYDLPLSELQRFRQWESKTPGHPEYGWTPGVEATTGPLGQGCANAVGMAIAEAVLAQRYNRPGHAIVDHWTYALVSDGDLMEGISAEAASLAAHLGLGKLVYLYDSNRVSLDGPLALSFSEDVAQRYAAYGWHVQRVEDGDRDLGAIDAALRAARAESKRPSLIIVNTTIGFGSPNKQGTSKAHGAPLGADEVKLTKRALGCDPERNFDEPPAALAELRSARERGAAAQAAWEQRFAAWAAAHPALAAEWKAAQGGELPAGWDETLPVFKAGQDPATREAGGKAIQALAARIPWLIGGDADLSESTKTAIEGSPDFRASGGGGRNLRYGVREHAMGAIANGIAYHGGLRSYTATFFVFSDYMRPALRLAAMNHLPVTFVYTHDSVAVGEDGPTHQPIEQLAALRAMPNLHVLRPAEANETSEAWRYAMRRTDGPCVLVLSRQKLPVLEGKAAGLARGAYVLREPANGAPRALLIATGSEVHVALEAQKLLAAEGIAARVVSMPCWEAFAAQSEAYRESVLPAAIRARVSIEAGTTFGWERWLAGSGKALGIDRYGASAPGALVLEKLGITAENAARLVRAQLAATPAGALG